MMQKIGLRVNDLTWRLVDREIVLLDFRTSKYFSINSSGAVLWKLLSQGTDRDRLSDELCQAYGLDTRQARRDVNQFMGQLHSHGLIETQCL